MSIGKVVRARHSARVRLGWHRSRARRLEQSRLRGRRSTSSTSMPGRTTRSTTPRSSTTRTTTTGNAGPGQAGAQNAAPQQAAAGDGDATAGNDGTAGGDNTQASPAPAPAPVVLGDGDATAGNDGTAGGDNTQPGGIAGAVQERPAQVTPTTPRLAQVERQATRARTAEGTPASNVLTSRPRGCPIPAPSPGAVRPARFRARSSGPVAFKGGCGRRHISNCVPLAAEIGVLPATAVFRSVVPSRTDGRQHPLSGQLRKAPESSRLRLESGEGENLNTHAAAVRVGMAGVSLVPHGARAVHQA